MGDILNEAYGVVQCKECPWYKSCVTPMRFTAEDLRKQLESSPLGMNPSAERYGFAESAFQHGHCCPKLFTGSLPHICRTFAFQSKAGAAIETNNAKLG